MKISLTFLKNFVALPLRFLAFSKRAVFALCRAFTQQCGIVRIAPSNLSGVLPKIAFILSIILLCGFANNVTGQTVVFSQNWEGAASNWHVIGTTTQGSTTSIPSGTPANVPATQIWTAYNQDGTANALWHQDNYSTGWSNAYNICLNANYPPNPCAANSTTYSAIFDNYDIAAGHWSSIQSPAFSLNGYGAATLSFYYTNDNTGTMNVQFWNGSAWVDVVGSPFGATSTNGWTQVSVAVPSACLISGTDLKFLANDGGLYPIGVDEIVVSGCITPTTTYSLTGGGSYCAGGSGVAIGLSGSQSTATYQLLLGGVAQGSPVAGTGSAFSFPNQTSAGTYTVTTTTATGGLCAALMAGSPSSKTVTITNGPPTLAAPSATASSIACGGTSTLSETFPTCAQCTQTTYGTSPSVKRVYSYTTTSGTSSLTLPTGFSYANADVLVVGGGGSGGSSDAGGYPGSGGGGAGGYVSNTAYSLTAGTISVTVAPGGAALAAETDATGNGYNTSSTAYNSVFGSITAYGGGGGGSGSSGNKGGNGASSGGGTYYNNPGNVTPVATEGYIGGGVGCGSAESENSPWPGSGGGGAGGAGTAGCTTAGSGGPGVSNSITGSAVIYAAGGAGNSGTGSAPGAAAANTGNGGGGSSGTSASGAGGSGIVIVSMPDPTAGVWSISGTTGSATGTLSATTGSSTILTATAGPGTLTVSYTLTSGTCTSVASNTITVSSSCCTVPTVSALSPTSACAGSGQVITLTGTNFTATSTATVNGTAATFTYSSATSATVTLPAGASSTGNIVVSNGSCVSATGSANAFTVNALPTAVTATPSATSQCGGTITVTASGGTGGTLYWQGTTSNGTSTATTTNPQTVSSSGTYYWGSKSAAGCWVYGNSGALTISTAPTAVTATPSATSQCGGTITVTASGGTGGTLYWQGTTSNGTSTATTANPQTVSSSGTYYWASNNGACWVYGNSGALTINTVPTAVTVTPAATSQCGGTITVTASGGTGGTLYWQGTTSNGTSTATTTNPQTVSSSGTYYWGSKSAGGCWVYGNSGALTISTAPTAVTATPSATSQCGGTITVTASGGTGGTLYWQGTTSNGTSTATTANPQTVSSSGTYYWASNNGACWVYGNSGALTISTAPTAVTATPSATSQCGGTITVTASGGTGGTLYWEGTTSNGTSTATTANPQTVSSSGTYYWASNNGACWVYGNSGALTINAVPTAVTATPSATSQCGGTITLTASGGTGGTLYWQGTTSNGTSTATTTNPQTVSSSGTYYWGSKSAAGCWVYGNSGALTISTAPTAVTATPSATSQCGGTITVTASGGTGGTLYWEGTTSNGTSTATTANPQTVSSSGTYYWASNNGACWVYGNSGALTISTAPTAVTATPSATSQCGGTITVTGSGGTGGTLYWEGTTSNGTSTATTANPQTVSSSGTYYWASNNGACWVYGNSGALTINSGAVTAGGFYYSTVSGFTPPTTGTKVVSTGFSGSVTDALTGLSPCTTYYYTSYAVVNGDTIYASNAQQLFTTLGPSAPTVGTITQPSCSSATGSVALSGLPSGSWTVTGSPSGSLSGSGTTGTVTGLTAGNTYTFTVTSGGCTSGASGNAVVNAAPTVPAAPTIGTITQPTCTTATGSVALSGLPAAAWTVTGSPSGSLSGSTTTGTVTGLTAGTTYTFTVTLTSSGCTSGVSGNAVVNAQPVTPGVPTIGTITQPTCTVATGSVALSGLPSGSWTVAGSPSGSLSGSGTTGTVTGLTASTTYTFTVTSSGCTSGASANAVVNAQPGAPSAPIVGTITQPTCATSTASVALSNLPAGSWTVTGSPSGSLSGSGTTGTVTGLAAGHTYTFTVSSGGCSSGASGNAVVNALPSSPTVTGLSPSSSCPGSNATITVTGTGFTGSSTATVNGTAATVVFVSATTLHVTMPTTVTTAFGNVVVTNSGCSSATSAANAFNTGLNGTYTVGALGNFTTLTAAVTYANTYGLCGPTVFSLTNTSATGYTDANSGGSEVFPIIIYALSGSSATNTLTIQPATMATIFMADNPDGDPNYYAMLELSAASNIIINGIGGMGSGNNLTIKTSEPYVIPVDFYDACQNVQINNCNVLAYSIGGENIEIEPGGSTNPATISVINNNIGDYNLAGGYPSWDGLYSYNRYATVTVTGNSFYNFLEAGAWLHECTDACTISNNSFYYTQTYTSGGTTGVSLEPVVVEYGSGHTISGNYIGGRAANGGTSGSPLTISSYDAYNSYECNLGYGCFYNAFQGITLSTNESSPTSTTVSNNVIQNISMTYTGNNPLAFNGIVCACPATISGNTIGNSSSALGITVGGSGGTGAYLFYGIQALQTVTTSSAVIDVTGNTIANVTNNGTGNVVADANDYGYPSFTCDIILASSTYGGSNGGSVSNNTIYNVSSAGTLANNIFGADANIGPAYIVVTADNSNNFTPVDGIYISTLSSSANATGITVAGNTIYNLQATTTSAKDVAVVAIGMDATSGNLYDNKVYGLTNTATSTSPYPGIAAIRNWGGGGWQTYNNQVILNNSSPSSVYGIIDQPAGATDVYYFNSVYLGGSPSGSGLTSAAFAMPSNTGTLTLENNLLENARSAAGGNYSVAMNVTPTALTSNYNDLYVSGSPGYVGRKGATNESTMANWQGAYSTDANSQNAAITFSQSNPPTTDLTPSLTGNCGIISGKGVYIGSGTYPPSSAGTGITYDYNGTLDSRNNPPTIGAIEVVIPVNTAGTPSSTPTLCINTALTNITIATTGATGITGGTSGTDGLPAGVSATWGSNTITISGTPTASGTFTYTIPLTGGCGTVNATGTITVTPANTAGSPSSTPTLCINTALTNITIATTGATSISGGGSGTDGLPAGVSATWGSNTITISGTPTASGTFTYTIPLTGGCGTVNATGTITVTPANTAGTPSSTPTLCINTALTNITIATTGATGITGGTSGTDGLPAGVSATWGSNTITISGTPTASGTFTYTIPLTGGCGTVNATGTITVTPANTAGSPSSTPTLCINTALTNITIATTGATGITGGTSGTDGLPAGVSATWGSNTITISGTPTASGTFTYTIPLTGGCGTVNATGTITVTPANTAGSPSSTPTLCVNTALTNITIATTGATGISGGGPGTDGLPAGVSATWGSNTITISGTPTASGTFTYAIPLTGGCGTVSATGTITVKANNTAGSPSSTPTLCINTALTNITIATTGATGITGGSSGTDGLPAGVSAAWAANTITISGTPTTSGTFSYSIPLTGGCSSVNATGTITVTPANTAGIPSSTPTLCINTALGNITIATTGATGISGGSSGTDGLPAGVSAVWSANIITISGTPTASGTFNYTIPLTGGCGTVNATGTITVSPVQAITLTSGSNTPASFCQNTALPTNIVYTLSGSATGASTAGLPTGMSGNLVGLTYTISGTPSVSGTFNYTVTTSGTCATATATGTIVVAPIATIGLTSGAGTNVQSTCTTTAITSITYSVGGGGTGAGVTGLPSGVTGNYSGGVFTISGTPSATGTFNYTVTTTGTCAQATATGTITVDPLASYGTITATAGTAQNLCANITPAGTFTVTGATGGAGSFTYQWYSQAGIQTAPSGSIPGSWTLIAGANSASYAPTGTSSSVSYACVVTPTGAPSCVGSAAWASGVLQMTVGTPTAFITGGNDSACVVALSTNTLTASTGYTATWQWQSSTDDLTFTDIGGATSSTYAAPTSTVGELYYHAIATYSGSGCTPATSNNEYVYVAAQPSVVTSPGTIYICQGGTGYLGTVLTGGVGPTYQWQFNPTGFGFTNVSDNNSNAPGITYGGTNTQNPLDIITSATAYTGTVPYRVIVHFSGTGCAASLTPSPGTAIINPQVIFNTQPASSTSICAGSSTSLTIAASRGFTLTYEWQYSNSGTWGDVANSTPAGFTYTGSAAATLSISTDNVASPIGSYGYRCIVHSTGADCNPAISNTGTIVLVGNPTVVTPTVSINPVCITSSGGGTNIQLATSQTGVSYQLQNISGPSNVGSAVSGTGGAINLPTGSMSASTIYQVLATATSGGCATTTAILDTVTAVNPDIAIGTQITGDHYTFGTIGSPALPIGWSNPGTAGVEWGLGTSNPASSGSYSYYNNTGGTSTASTGAYITTPTGASTTTVSLISGTINTTGYTNISVQWAAQKSAGYAGVVNLYYSTDNGSTWSGAVSFTDVPDNLSGTPWSLVNNTVQIKLPVACNNSATLKLKWTANAGSAGVYYSMNDIGIYGLSTISNCAGTSVALTYLNTSCSASNYNIGTSTVAGVGSAWPSLATVTNGTLPSSPLSITVPATTATGTYDVDFTVNDGAGHSSGTISFPVTTDPAITVTANLDNCSCNNTASIFGNIITLYAWGGSGVFYFNSGAVVDSLRTTIDASGINYAGTANHSGVKGIFWSKADGNTHSYSINDGYCTVTPTKVTQSTKPGTIPFGSATGVPVQASGLFGGGNGISGSFSSTGQGDPAISSSQVNGPALTCHQTSDFGSNWVTYQVNNIDSQGQPLTGDSTNNKAVVEINNNGVNLDSVSVSVYRDAALPEIPNSATGTTACYGYQGYALERHFMIKSTKSAGANAFATPVGVRLYFTDAEFQDLKYWTMNVATHATGQAAGCAYLDTVTNMNSIYVTKYTGANEDGNYLNNQAAPSGLYRVFGKNSVENGNSPLTAIDAEQALFTTGGTTNLHYVQMNVTEFSEFWLGGSQGGEALPVTMIYLEAEAMNNDSIQVRWATATEVNNHEFDVERSTDGNTWTTIGIVPGHDNSTQQNNYAYNDLNVVPGVTYYYRLKQVDNNGNYQYTDIVQAAITATSTFTVMNFVPNPTSGSTQLTVVTSKNQEITVDFFDMLGQRVLAATEQLVPGNNRISFDLHRFAAGTYSAVVTSESQLYTKKIVVTR